jgi:histidinol-phosphate phosphatase family protein
MRDVGTEKRHATAARDLADGTVAALNIRNKRPAIFFDVDGVLNEEPGTQGALKPDDVTLIAGAGAAVADAHAAQFLTVAITNRPQVARGDITFDDLDALLGRLEALLAERGGVLDRIFVCPHHPDRGFPGEITALKIRCECRKPGALLFRRALEELPIDRARSVAIGDSLRDIGAAKATGVWAYGVRTGYGCRDTARYPGGATAAPVPDLMFDDVREAVRFALGYQTLVAPLMQAIRDRPSEQPTIILVHELPGIIAGLRAGTSIIARGYHAAKRTQGPPVTYAAAGHRLILVEGVFAAHPSVRPMIDIAAFVDVRDGVQRARFDALYRWKGFEDAAIEDLWRARIADEWAAIDAQREHSDMVISVPASEP